MLPNELVNISLEYEVDVEPFTTIPSQRFLSFEFKGCNPLKVSRMPLYLALHLQSLNLCSIQRPSYLSKDYLENLKEKERRESGFVEVPEFLFEHAYLFMNNDIESAICEIKTLRMNKIWKGLSSMDSKALFINGLTKWEYNEFKDVIQRSISLGKFIEDVEYE